MRIHFCSTAAAVGQISVLIAPIIISSPIRHEDDDDVDKLKKRQRDTANRTSREFFSHSHNVDQIVF